MAQVKLPAGLPSRWQSPYGISEIHDLAARGDSVTAWQTKISELSYSAVARDQARSWANLMQPLMVGVNDTAGIPMSVAQTVVNNIGDFALNPPKNPKQLVERLARTGVATAINIVGAIPIVGPIVEGVAGLVETLVDTYRRETPPPKDFLPMLKDDEARDELLVNNVILNVAGGSYNWNDLFSPVFTGGWTVEQRSNGWLFRGKQVRPGACGFIPGSLQCSREIQAWFLTWSQVDCAPGRCTDEQKQKIEALWGTPQITGVFGKREPGANRKQVQVPTTNPSNRGGDLPDSMDLGSWLTGASQCIAELEQQCQGYRPPGSKQALAQSQMWFINPDLIAKRWKNYILSAVEFAHRLYHGGVKEAGIGSLSEEYRQLLARAFLKQFLVSTHDDRKAGAFSLLSWDFKLTKLPTNTIYHKWIQPWASTMMQRQRAFTDSYLVATAPWEGGAYEDNRELRTLVMGNQSRLLRHPARDKVDQRDIIVPQYREAMFENTAGGRLTWGQPVARITEGFTGIETAARPSPPQGGSPFEGALPRGAPWWAVSAGLGISGIGAYLLWKMRR